MGVSAVVTTWNDTTIVATARAVGQIPLCAVQQQAQYGGSQARCGELVITAGNGKTSVDTVTVTIGGKAPTHVTPTSITGSSSAACVAAAGTVTFESAIQTAIDCANPGDLIIVHRGRYHELLQMWKPVRLQGVGAANTIIDANAHPAGI